MRLVSDLVARLSCSLGAPVQLVHDLDRLADPEDQRVRRRPEVEHVLVDRVVLLPPEQRRAPQQRLRAGHGQAARVAVVGLLIKAEVKSRRDGRISGTTGLLRVRGEPVEPVAEPGDDDVGRGGSLGLPVGRPSSARIRRAGVAQASTLGFGECAEVRGARRGWRGAWRWLRRVRAG